jgi:lysophospholipase L1-like esterase
MTRMQFRFPWVALMAAFLAGCSGGGGGGGLQNKDPGDNDLNVVVAFGDSITNGSECDCAPYPRRLAQIIGKSVLNTGVSATRAIESVDRTQEAIDKYQPAFMLILYGVNDIIHSSEVDSIVDALRQMVGICEANQVVAVLATYPEPIDGRALFAPRTLLLNEGIRSLAKELGVKCVDLEQEFEANPEFYESDGLHPNNEGTQLMALAFADLF